MINRINKESDRIILQGDRYCLRLNDWEKIGKTKYITASTKEIIKEKHKKDELRRRKYLMKIKPLIINVRESIDYYFAAEVSQVYTPWELNCYYKRCIRRIVDKIGDVNINQIDINDYLTSVSYLYNKESLKEIAECLKTTIKLILDKDVDYIIPETKLNAFYIIPDDEKKELISYCSSEGTINDYIILFLLYTGLQVPEALNLTWDNITEDSILVDNRKILLDIYTLKLLSKCKHTDEKIFPISEWATYRRLKTIEKETGIPDIINTKNIRATKIMELYNNSCFDELNNLFSSNKQLNYYLDKYIKKNTTTELNNMQKEV